MRALDENVLIIATACATTERADFLSAVYIRRGVTCTLGLTNDLIEGSQPRAKPHPGKAKPNHVLKTVFSPRLATVYQVVG